MNIRVRHYKRPVDFNKVGNFLLGLYQPGNMDGNWFQPTWEYMHSHPKLDESSLERIGIWEDSGDIVAVVHYEADLGEVFFEVHPRYTFLKLEMLQYAEKYLYGITKEGQRFIKACIHDQDKEFEAIATAQGYEINENKRRPMSQFKIMTPFPKIVLPEGFKIKSLQEDNDLHKIHRVLWRGFNHPGEPSEDGIEGRMKMQSGPNFRKDLTIVVEAPNGDFVSFCGMWYESRNKFAYVEPVATDPDFRRMGLGKAAVLEGIRRCAELGATMAYVGSEQKFYNAIGFELLFKNYSWEKYW